MKAVLPTSTHLSKEAGFNPDKAPHPKQKQPDKMRSHVTPLRSYEESPNIRVNCPDCQIKCCSWLSDISAALFRGRSSEYEFFLKSDNPRLEKHGRKIGQRLMVENPPITVLAEPTEINSHGNHATVIGLELDIFDQPLHFRIAAAQRHARLADIVPMARVLSTKLAWAILDKLHKQKNFVPCRKACSACCSYLIPLSVPEVFRMREEILAMPAKQSKAVLTSCLDAAKRILDSRPESFDPYSLTTANDPTQVSQLGRWYADLKLACPFLSSGLCTIYEQRPTACREHFATGSALLCETEWMDQSQLVRMPVSILDALGQLAGELEGTSVQAVMLPLASPWAQENLERDQRTWPAVIIVERFVEILKTMASKNLAAAVACP